MSDDKTEFAEGRPDLATIKEMRREHPSGWLELSMDPSRALLIDAILDSPPEYEFSPVEISPRAGISDQSVRNHIDILVDRGVVQKVDDSRYRVNEESRILKELEELNSAVTAIRSNMGTVNFVPVDPDDLMDNSRHGESTTEDRSDRNSTDNLFNGPPSMKGLANAD